MHLSELVCGKMPGFLATFRSWNLLFWLELYLFRRLRPVICGRFCLALMDLGTSDDVESCTRHCNTILSSLSRHFLKQCPKSNKFIKNPAKIIQIFNKYCKSLQWWIQLFTSSLVPRSLM